MTPLVFFPATHHACSQYRENDGYILLRRLIELRSLQRVRKGVLLEYCSVSIYSDINLAGKIATREVFNDKAATNVFQGVQAGGS